MPKRILGLGLVLLLAGSAAREAEATVLVQDTDIVGGEYVFEINYANIFSQWSAALVSSTAINPQTWCCSATRFALVQQGVAYAEFTLAFDFSATSFQPNAVEITDRVTLFTNTATERVEAQVLYGQDGVSFATQRIAQTPNDGGLVNDSWDTYQLPVSAAQPVFYYRVTFEPMPIDPDGLFTHPQNQWARTDGPGTGTTSYSARFFTVPEPALAVLLLPLAARVWRTRRVWSSRRPPRGLLQRI